MAIGVYFHPQEMKSEQYDRVVKKLEEAGAGSPPGRMFHCSFEVAGALHVFDVWESQESFEQFGQTLVPILENEGVDPGQPSISPIHNIVRA